MSGQNDSGRMGDDQEVFGKAPNSGDASLNMSSKIDERTSLLPDGTRAIKKNDNLDESSSAKVDGEGRADGTASDDDSRPMSRSQIYTRREEVVDKALISAVKTLASLTRQYDLMAYSRHPRIMKVFADKYTI